MFLLVTKASITIFTTRTARSCLTAKTLVSKSKDFYELMRRRRMSSLLSELLNLVIVEVLRDVTIRVPTESQ